MLIPLTAGKNRAHPRIEQSVLMASLLVDIDFRTGRLSQIKSGWVGYYLPTRSAQSDFQFVRSRLLILFDVVTG